MTPFCILFFLFFNSELKENMKNMKKKKKKKSNRSCWGWRSSRRGFWQRWTKCWGCCGGESRGWGWEARRTYRRGRRCERWHRRWVSRAGGQSDGPKRGRWGRGGCRGGEIEWWGWNHSKLWKLRRRRRKQRQQCRGG